MRSVQEDRAKEAADTQHTGVESVAEIQPDDVWNHLPASVVLDANKQLTIFCNFGTGGHLYQAIQDVNGKWSEWADLGGPITNAAPTALLTTLGSPEPIIAVMARGKNLVLIYRRTNPYGGRWEAWKEGGGHIVGHISALASGGLAAVFATSSDGTLWTLPSLVAAPAGWLSLGNEILPDPVAITHNGGIEVFARGKDQAVLNIALPKNAANWGSWHSLGGISTSNLAVSELNGYLRIFARGSDGKLWWIKQFDSGSGLKWGDWSPLGCQITSAPAVYVDEKGLDHVFARGPDGDLGYVSRKPLAPDWTAWTSLGKPADTVSISSAPLVFKYPNPDQALVFVRGSDNSIWWLIYRPGAVWKTWEEIPPPRL